ncbi:MAG: hypothetical protein ABSE06_01260 [Anaerolineaceae bacterium]|jgi:hypothetical protein
MSDFDQTPEFPTEPQTPAEEPEADFFDGATDDGAVALPNPASVITLRTSGGDTRYVPVPDGQTTMTVAEVVSASAVYVGGAVNYWLNGAQVQAGDSVPAGSVLTLVGSVKGG